MNLFMQLFFFSNQLDCHLGLKYKHGKNGLLDCGNSGNQDENGRSKMKLEGPQNVSSGESRRS